MRKSKGITHLFMKRFVSKYLLAIIIALQAFLCFVAFLDFRMYPDRILFSDVGDGLKNYFTLLSYVKEDVPEHTYFRQNVFNYPFGEYIYSADLTPSFAVPFKWFCRNVYDLSDHTTAVYNLFIIVCLIACAAVAYLFFKKAFKNQTAAFILAMVLPWINMQTVRIWRGHMNLSIAFFIPLALLLFYYWYKREQETKNLWGIIAAMVGLNVYSFFTHGYYIAIIGIFQAGMLFFYAFYHWKEKRMRQKALISSIAIPSVSLLIILSVLAFTDGFFHHRPAGAGGYDWMEHKIRFWSLISHNTIQKSIRFPIRFLKGSTDPENMGYLGNMGLYATLFIAILSIASLKYRAIIKEIQHRFFRHPFFAPVFLGSLLMLIISFGDNYYTNGFDGFVIYNYLNPLFYLHQFTKGVEQFRSMGRFAWPFFWGFYVWVAYTLLHLLPHFTEKIKKLVLIAVIILGGFEVKDYVDAAQGSTGGINYLNPSLFPSFEKLNIDYEKYQAVLSIPYYNVGSENIEWIIDDWDLNSRQSFQLALFSKLPLINVKLSRTILAQAQQLGAMVSKDSLSDDLRAKLNDKPILVMYDRATVRDSSLHIVPRDERSRETYWQSTELIQRHNLQPNDSIGTLYFYEWYTKK